MKRSTLYFLLTFLNVVLAVMLDAKGMIGGFNGGVAVVCFIVGLVGRNEERGLNGRR